MDAQSKQMLDQILAKEPAALADSEKEFLRARSAYLSPAQRGTFAEVLGETVETANSESQFEPEPEQSEDKESSPEETSTDETPIRRGRKPKVE